MAPRREQLAHAGAYQAVDQQFLRSILKRGHITIAHRRRRLSEPSMRMA